MMMNQQVFALLFLIFSYNTCHCLAFQPSSWKAWSSLASITDPRTALDVRIDSTHTTSPFQQRESLPSFSPSALSLSEKGDSEIDEGSAISPLGVVGVVSQPIVWVSLGFVATTGAGLPAGPFGLLGAVEGLSYLVVVGFVASNIISDDDGGKERKSDASLETTAQKLSAFTLLLALLTLASLVKGQGCVPNAKPILDYSSYLPVCNPEDTPGLFGS